MIKSLVLICRKLISNFALFNIRNFECPSLKMQVYYETRVTVIANRDRKQSNYRFSNSLVMFIKKNIVQNVDHYLNGRIQIRFPEKFHRPTKRNKYLNSRIEKCSFYYISTSLYFHFFWCRYLRGSITGLFP